MRVAPGTRVNYYPYGNTAIAPLAGDVAFCTSDGIADIRLILNTREDPLRMRVRHISDPWIKEHTVELRRMESGGWDFAPSAVEQRLLALEEAMLEPTPARKAK